jgi:hypothetical protein
MLDTIAYVVAKWCSAAPLNAVRRRREDEIMTSNGDAAPLLPYTGKEFLDSLDDGREVWIYGERVSNIAEHPAFRNTARG